jgi:hypothetical protein
MLAEQPLAALVELMRHAAARSHGFSGWYGLEAHRVNERIIQLARHHYRDTVALIVQASQASGAVPLVIGGHLRRPCSPG